MDRSRYRRITRCAACSNVVLTPHLGYGTREVYAQFYRESIENVLAFLDGKPTRCAQSGSAAGVINRRWRDVSRRQGRERRSRYPHDDRSIDLARIELVRFGPAVRLCVNTFLPSKTATA
mgnify:CR=1 FL=1